MEKCQALRQGQCHPQGTAPVTGVLGQVVAQGALGEAEKRGGHTKLEEADSPQGAEINCQTSLRVFQQTYTRHTQSTAVGNAGVRVYMTQIDRKNSSSSLSILSTWHVPGLL